MDWLTGGGGGGDGWDDDDLGDFSDEEEFETETETSEYSGSQQQQQQQQQQEPTAQETDLSGAGGGTWGALRRQLQQSPPPPPPPQEQQPSNNNSISLGGGMFMGRLTQFLGAVTQPQSDYDEDEDDSNDEGGWNEDDGLGDEDLNNLDNDDNDGGNAWDNDDLTGLDDNDAVVPPPPPPPAAQTSPAYMMAPLATSASVAAAHVPPPMTDLVDSGWDDDLDMTLDQQQPPAAAPQGAPVGSTDGWHDEDGGLENVLEVVAPSVAVDHTPPSHQSSTISNGARTNETVAASSAGWDEDGLDGLDDDFAESDERMVASNPKATSVPPPPPPPKQQPAQTAVVPPPPPPRPPAVRQGSNQSVTFGSVTEQAAPDPAMDGWDDDDDDEALFDDKQAETAPSEPATQQILDHTPPPPPPPRNYSREHSQAISFAAESTGAIVSDSGWDDGDDVDDGLDDLDVDTSGAKIDTTAQENTQVVDSTPPPPLPPVSTQRLASSSAVAVAIDDEADNDGVDDGWDDDDLDDLGGDGNATDANTATPLVDHTPPPPPPESGRGRDTKTDAAIDQEDDDISRDDTLSIANSRVRYEENHPPRTNEGPPLVDMIPAALSKAVAFNRSETLDAIKSGASVGSSTLDDFRQSTVGDMSYQDETQPLAPLEDIVDHTPSLHRKLDRHDEAEESMLALGGGNTNNTVSSIGDSLDSNSDKVEGKPRTRRVVDHTPPAARFHRGMPVDTSMAVAGHTSVGESLDSIDEEDEESNSTATDQASSTPGALEAGLGNQRRGFAVSTSESMDTTEVPFGSAVTPNALGGMGRISFRIAEGDEDSVPLVDHTPIPLAKNQSTGASVAVLSVSSEEGDLGESIVGIDDVKEDLYGPMVDHTPATPNPSVKAKVSGGSAIGPIRQEDDTVVGVAENGDVERDFKQDDEMDDESSRGTKTTLEEFDSRSLISTVRLTIPEDEQLVDHVPTEPKTLRRTDASTVAFADASSGSTAGDNVNDDDTSPAAFGPIVDHTPSVHFRSVRSIATSVLTHNSEIDKEDDDLDNTIGPSIGEGWDGDQNSVIPIDIDEKHVVDHVPKRPLTRLATDGSMRVVLDPQDDMTQVDTIAEDAAVDFGPIVDHTPFTAKSSNQSVAASTAVQVDKIEDDDNTTVLGNSLGAEGWDNDIPDLEDISASDEVDNKPLAEPALVDHVPPTGRSFSRPTDASTMVLIDPLDAISEVGGDESVSKGNSNKFGPVVDHTPAPPRSGTSISIAASMKVQAVDIETDIRQDDDGGTWFGASTTGGISTMGGVSAGEDDSTGGGWDDDEGLDDMISPMTDRGTGSDKNDHVVDHVPELRSPQAVDASVAVVVDPSVVSSQNKAEVEDTIDNGSFGAVVDQTPSIVPASQHSVANSMATIATGIVTDIKREEDMDVSTQGDGWDQDEPELENIAEADDDQMPPLVDHVPERPESRPTDASTIVAGDPSEMFSQVDDLGQDETHFGPVVDLTPPSQAAHPSAAGSTIVNIASVAEDDLDAAVENAIDGTTPEDPSNQVGWQETLPNPQSGNEEANADREQLVDYVPAEEEEPIPDLVRDASSEMATVGEKSTMLPADDPKEDEFGPVVDHTPIPDPSIPAAATPMARSTSDDSRKPAARNNGPGIDSVAPNFSVHSKESKDDEEDEFGPVVDQLPTAALKANLPPSRGGSTVDALATVSEVDDDYIAGDGWEDDTEIDVGDQPSPAATSRANDDRNLSVRWIDRLSEKDSAAFLQRSGNNSKSSLSTGESGFFDADMGDSSKLSLNETRYYDPEHDMNDDDDDTPPSTPRSSFQFEKTSKEDEELKLAPTPADAADSVGTPEAELLLETEANKGKMVGHLKAPDGRTVAVNFEKLLAAEITKRKLLERESEALRKTIGSLKNAQDGLTGAGEKQMDVLLQLQTANKTLVDELTAVNSAASGLRSEKESLESKTNLLAKQLEALNAEKSKLEKDGLSLKQEMKVLENRVKQVSLESSSNLTARENSFQTEISTLRTANQDLNHRIARFETECENLRGKNTSLYEDLETYRESLDKLERENTSLQSKDSALTVEIDHLKAALESRPAMDSDLLHGQIQNLQAEIAAKTGECTELRTTLTSIQKRLTSAEAERFKHVKELSRKEQEAAKARSLHNEQLQTTKHELEKALSAKDAVINEYKMKLETESKALQTLRNERVELETKKQNEANVLRNSVSEKDAQLRLVESELQQVQKRLQESMAQNNKMASDLAKFKQDAAKTSILNTNLQVISVERDGLKESLSQSNGTILSMQKQLDDISREKEESLQLIESMKIEIDSLGRRCEEVQVGAAKSVSPGSLAEKDKELVDLIAQRDQLLQDIHHARVAEDEAKYELKEVKEKVSELDSLVASKDQIIVILKEQQSSSRAGFQDLQKENQSLSAKVEELNGSFQAFDAERRQFNSIADQQSEAIDRLNADLLAITGERDEFGRERDLLTEENEEMLVQFGMLKEQMDEYDLMISELNEQVADKDQMLADTVEKLAETEERLVALQSHMQGETQDAILALEASKAEVLHEKKLLESKLKKVEDSNANMNESLELTKSENRDLRAQVEDLKESLEDLQTRSKVEEARLKDDLEELGSQNTELNDRLLAHSADIENLKQSLVQAQNAAADAATLFDRVEQLEQDCVEKDRALEHKDAMIQDLHLQLQNAGRAPIESAETEMLRRTLQEMQESAEQDRANIQELESSNAEASRDLNIAANKLKKSEHHVSQLQEELIATKAKVEELILFESRAKESELLVKQVKERSSVTDLEVERLRRELQAMQLQMQESDRTQRQLSEEPTGQSSAEVQSLRQQVEALKQNQIASSSETGAREEEIERQVHLLQKQMKDKDDDISKLEQKIHLLASDLSHKHRELASKQEHVNRLSSQLEDMRSNGANPDVTRALELTKGDAEDREQMRSHIVSLAKALERSEGNRAEAIERLERERKANADSLRRLTESVKRFYSTISLGEN